MKGGSYLISFKSFKFAKKYKDERCISFTQPGKGVC